MSYNNMSDGCRNHYPFFHEECSPCNFNQEVAYHQSPPADIQYSTHSHGQGVTSNTNSDHDGSIWPFAGQVSYTTRRVRHPVSWTPQPSRGRTLSFGTASYKMASNTPIDENESPNAASGHDGYYQAEFGGPVSSSRDPGPSTSNTSVNLNELLPSPSTVPAKSMNALGEPANITFETAVPPMVAAKNDDIVHTSPPVCNLSPKHAGDIPRVHVAGLFKSHKSPGFKIPEIAEWLHKEIKRKSSDDLRAEAMYITNNKDQILDEIKQLAYTEAKTAVDIAFEKTTTILKSQKYMSHWSDFLRHLPESDARRFAMRKLVNAKYSERRRLIQLEGDIPRPFPACQTNPSLHNYRHTSFVSQKTMGPVDAMTPGAQPTTAREAIQRAMLKAECGSNRDAYRKALRTAAWYTSVEDEEDDHDSKYQEDDPAVADSKSNDNESLESEDNSDGSEMGDSGMDGSEMDGSEMDDSEMDGSEMDDSEDDEENSHESEPDSEDIEDSEFSGDERSEISEDDKPKSDRFLPGFVVSQMAKQYGRVTHVASEKGALEYDQAIQARVANNMMDQEMRPSENEDRLVAELKELKGQVSRYSETQARLVAEFQRQESKHRENEARMAAELKASESKLSNVEGRLTDQNHRAAALRTGSTAANEMINETTPNERVIYTQPDNLAKIQVQAIQITREYFAAKKHCSGYRNHLVLGKALSDYQVKAKQINRKYRAVQGTGTTEDKIFEIREAMEEKRRENNRQILVAEQEARRVKGREALLLEQQSRLERLKHPSGFRVLREATVSSVPWASRPSFTQAGEQGAIQHESHRPSMRAQREQVANMRNLSHKAPEPVANSTFLSIAWRSKTSQKTLWSMPEAPFVALKPDHERSDAKGEKDVAIIRERMEREVRLVRNKRFAHTMKFDHQRAMPRRSMATTMPSTRSKSPESTASISSTIAERPTSPNQCPTGPDSPARKFIDNFGVWREIDDDIEKLKLQKNRETLASANRADNLRNFKNFSEAFKLDTPVPEGLLTKLETPKEPQTPKELLNTLKTEAAKNPTSASSSYWQRRPGKSMHEAHAQCEVKGGIEHDENTLSVPRRPLRAVPMIDDDIGDSWSTKSVDGSEKDVQERSNTQSVATYAQWSGFATHVVGDDTKEDEEIAETEEEEEEEEEEVIKVEEALAKLKDSIAEVKDALVKRENKAVTEAEEEVIIKQNAVVNEADEEDVVVKEEVVEQVDPVVAQTDEIIAETVEGPDVHTQEPQAGTQDEPDCSEAATEYSWSEASDNSVTSESVDWEMVDESD